MFTDRMDFTSLCYISGELDNNGKPWLSRIADIEDGKLVPPRKSKRPTKYFENRDRILWRDGPTQKGEIGIWDWFTSPNRNDPNVDHIESYYVSDGRPIRVIILPDAKTIEFIVENLAAGIQIEPPFNCDFFFCLKQKLGRGRYWDKFNGLLCRRNDLTVSNELIKLRDNVYSLPQYSFTTEDIYTSSAIPVQFLKILHVDNPESYVSVEDIDAIIRFIILSKITWPIYRDTVKCTKKEWKDCQLLLKRICTESIYEEVAREVVCSLEQAKQAVTNFCVHANDLIDQGDIDSEILSQIVTYHDGLRTQCEKIAAEKWKQSHQIELSSAQSELRKIKEKKAQIEREIKSFQDQITSAQSQLEKLKSDITHYETLGNETLQAVQKKIGDAQEDVAGFIAELSMFLPQSTVAASTVSSLCHYKMGISVSEEDKPEICECWVDELDLLQRNLNLMSFDSDESRDLNKLLSAFLYAAYVQNIPLLIAGPYAHEFADAVSLSVAGRYAGILALDGRCDTDIIKQLETSDDTVIIVQNAFGKDWDDNLLQSLMRLNKFIIWTRPYIEDLLIEPKGLYNYALPLFTEHFVETKPASQFVPGMHSKKFFQYPLRKQHPNRSKMLQKLGMSKLAASQLHMVLSNASAMIDLRNRDLEFLFAILPFAVLTGQKDVLEEILDTEKNISNTVKTEIKHYLGED